MNIQDALVKLKNSGMTDKRIGDAIRAPQSIVTRLRNGVHKTTSYERGEAIMRLAREKFPERAD